ncbi:MAG: hypothetical protein IPH57_10490 [Saprospiraceae bacterium]|nr:hypothetical protein [Saprospiraceae bacterium]
MKIFLSATLFVLYAVVLFSQNEPSYKDMIILKNGSKLYGSIIDYRVGGEVKLRLENGSLLTFTDDVVSKIEIYSPTSKNTRPFNIESNTIYHAFGIKLIPGSNIYSDNPRLGMGLEYSLGYRFNNYASLGGGAGAEYFNYGFNEFFFPVFMDYMTFLRKSPISPFLRLQAGYGLLHTNSDNIIDKAGGLMFNPAFGFKFQGGYGINFTLDINFKYQEAKFTYRGQWGNQIYNRDVTFQRLLLRFGIIF